MAEMPEAIEKARKKAVSFFNRWFKKRSPEEILRQSETWQQLSREAVIDSEKFKDIDVLAASIEKWNKAIGGLRKW
ncbi:MAG: hypothetical protein K2J46_09690 [Muribaculaceae bacterium]|nr:hypothetical protein [Muribaculaceae bacterium]